MKIKRINALLGALAVIAGTSMTACAGSKAEQENIADAAIDAVEETTETAGATGDPTANNDLTAANDVNSGTWKKLPSGLEYQVIEEGKGAKPKADDVVSVVYTGYLPDGTIFDATANHGGEEYTSFQQGDSGLDGRCSADARGLHIPFPHPRQVSLRRTRHPRRDSSQFNAYLRR